MDSNFNWDAISAISTAFAALVALALGAIPPLLSRFKERRLATERTYNRLKTVQLVVKKYRYYNVQEVIQDGYTQYQYDTNNAKGMTININLYEEANQLNELSENLGSGAKSEVKRAVDLLIRISSGFPFHQEDWDRLEALIKQSIEELEQQL
ncbi:hypothetical protein BA953_02600 [Vibrio coralliilyticus]|uniref:hypothetical protein n=1 Tax=Vibrio coralliilyticus TaxID=190893 RepID=UPI00081095AC|nr:hypothetical protein [Vibrio coralliilyticus]ANW23178.1 hypothetical protein BA953_02600 [Vibrio coralliilyticus]